jgi:hypothetical protein
MSKISLSKISTIKTMGEEGVMDQPIQHFTATGKVWRVVKDNKSSFLQQLLFLEICKRVL